MATYFLTKFEKGINLDERKIDDYGEWLESYRDMILSRRTHAAEGQHVCRHINTKYVSIGTLDVQKPSPYGSINPFFKPEVHAWENT